MARPWRGTELAVSRNPLQLSATIRELPGIVRVVAHGCGKAQAAVIDVDQVAQHGHVLGALVDHPRRLIFVKNQLHPVGPSALFGSEVGDVDHGGIDDAPLLDQQIPALALLLVGAGPAAKQAHRRPRPQGRLQRARCQRLGSRKANCSLRLRPEKGRTRCRISQAGSPWGCGEGAGPHSATSPVCAILAMRCQFVRLLFKARRRPPLRGPLLTQIPAPKAGAFAPLPFCASAEIRAW